MNKKLIMLLKSGKPIEATITEADYDNFINRLNSFKETFSFDIPVLRMWVRKSEIAFVTLIDIPPTPIEPMQTQ